MATSPFYQTAPSFILSLSSPHPLLALLGRSLREQKEKRTFVRRVSVRWLALLAGLEFFPLLLADEQRERRSQLPHVGLELRELLLAAAENPERTEVKGSCETIPPRHHVVGGDPEAPQQAPVPPASVPFVPRCFH